MNNEELGRRTRKLYNKYVKRTIDLGYDEPTIQEFLEWIEDLILEE